MPLQYAKVRAHALRKATTNRLQRGHTHCVEAIFLIFGAGFQAARESSDNPILNAFCRVAPSVRLRVRAMLAARVFFFASVFNVRTCAVVHAWRFDFLVI